MALAVVVAFLGGIAVGQQEATDNDAAAASAHADGYQEGRSDGYESGVEEGLSRTSTSASRARAEGYEAGHEAGYEQGHEQGHEAGFEEGRDAGYEAGASDSGASASASSGSASSGSASSGDDAERHPDYAGDPTAQDYRYGTAWLDELTYGTTDSESVRHLQWALQQEGYDVDITGNYLSETDSAVRAWQQGIGNEPDPVGESSLGRTQAERLFAPYDISVL